MFAYTVYEYHSYKEKQMQKKVSKELIIHGATELIEEEGYGNLTIHALAYRLGVKPSTLYNHMKNIDDLKKAIRICALEKMQAEIAEETKGKSGKEALIALANAIRSFAKENTELYKSIFNVTPNEGGIELTSLLDTNIPDFNLTKDEAIHFTRAFCSAVFGFIMLETSGYFREYANTDNSFVTMVALLLSSLNSRS